MTDEAKDQQLGQILREIKSHEEAMAPLLMKAQRIGRGFITLGERMESQFGVTKTERGYFGANVAGAKATDGLGSMLDDASGLEDEIRQHGRELARLYSQRSQLGW